MRRAALVTLLIGVAAVVTFALFYGGAAWVIDIVSNWPKPQPAKDGALGWWPFAFCIWMAVIMRNDDPSPAIRSAASDIRDEMRELRRAIQDVRAEMVKHRDKRPQSEAERRGWQ
jgi:hypothetical protein